MGTIEQTYLGSGIYYYAFGIEPKYDWTGLTDPSKIISLMIYVSAHWIPLHDNRVLWHVQIASNQTEELNQAEKIPKKYLETPSTVSSG
jgi:hypothetical protein